TSSGLPVARNSSMRSRRVISDELVIGVAVVKSARVRSLVKAAADTRHFLLRLQLRCYSVPVSDSVTAPMDPRQLEALAKRLAENANDTDALNTAYAHGQTDPRGYAVFLEKTGAAALDPATGAHWYCEAATVWTASLSDVHRAERAL